MGLWIWLSLFRMVEVVDEGKSSYSLILLKEAKEGDRVVFSYPDLNSPLRISKVSRSAKGVLMVDLNEETKEPLSEGLTIGILIF
ncbi:MAG: hypothetical protein ACRBBP_04010 [Bdellovibrionales bacterium]